MKILICFFLMWSELFFSQNYRAAYEYKFQTDSLSKGEMEVEFMNLDISGNGSKFYSRTIYESDSLLKMARKQQAGNTTFVRSLFKGKIRDVIEKEYATNMVDFYTIIEMTGYKVSAKSEIVWQILPEKKEFLGMKVQKAKTFFEGRVWTAWFSADIPIMDGPYKFFGLPGLIVKVESENKSHSFQLVSLKKVHSGWQREDNGKLKSKLINLDLDKYKTLFNTSRNNPRWFQQNTGAIRVGFQVSDQNGREISQSEALRITKQRNLMNNNPLNLWLLK